MEFGHLGLRPQFPNTINTDYEAYECDLWLARCVLASLCHLDA